MNTKVQVCRVYSSVLNESRIEICFERNNKQYMGPLFWSKEDWIDDRITRYLEVVDINSLSDKDPEGDDLLVVDTYLDLCKKHGIKTYDSTKKTMLHWMHMNGFTNFIHHTWEM